VDESNLPKILLVGAVAVAMAVAACGSSATASSNRPAASATAGPGRGNAVAGQLAQLNGSKLVLSGQTGVTNVTFGSSTRVVQTSVGTLADITAGTCITASGLKDASGTVTATTITLMTKQMMNGTCTPQGRNGASPSPGRFRGGQGNRPTPPPSFTFVRGEVAAVSGTSVTVTLTTGGTQAVTVPTTARISRTQMSSTSQLAVGQCIVATGSKDSSGTVQARSLSIQPKGPTGCTFGRGGGGFFGGGGQPGGGATTTSSS
jgi:hypothetical protein